MAFPKDMNHLKAHGYKFQNDAACKLCGDDIEWWETPSGKRLPFNPMGDEQSAAIIHLSTCTG